MRDSFIFYRSFYESLRELNSEDRCIVLEAIMEYALNQKTTPLKGTPKAIFILIKPQIDANQKRYENGLKGAKYGALGGRPKKKNNPKKTPKKPLNNPKQTPNVNENVNVNENENVKKWTRANFLKHQEKIRSEAKEKYKNKNIDKALKDFIERTEIKDYKYKNYKLAFFKWVRDDRFKEYRATTYPKAVDISKLGGKSKLYKTDDVELSEDQKKAQERYRAMMKKKSIKKL